MSKNMEQSELTFMEKVAAFIVDKRNFFFVFFVAACVFSIISSGWVEVEDDITKYLPEDTETRQGIDLMEKEFVTYGNAEIMVSNVSLKKAEELAEKIENIDGVSEVKFENTDEYFKGSSALFKVTFEGESNEEISENALDKIKELLSRYDVYVSSDVGYDSSKELQGEMNVIIVIAVIIIIAGLTFTSKSYAEVPVLMITFGVAALLNKGTNYILGTISYVSNSVAVILQLALAIDYAIILCHRYTEEREHLDRREATIKALSKAIPEISSSSLTTISGLAALITMEFGIGRDLAFVLIKAIFFSLFSVFTLMPGLIMLFGNLMEKTKHKNLVPSISFIGKADYKSRYVIPPIFLVVMIAAFFVSGNCPYAYSDKDIVTHKQSERQIADEKIRETFRQKTLLAVVVPSGEYEKEAKLLSRLEEFDEVEETVGLSNTEAMDGYMLTEALTPREFGELTEIDYSLAQALYAAYAVDGEDYGKIISNFESYSVPLIDMLTFLHKEVDEGYIPLDDETKDDIDDIYDKIDEGRKQLESDKYSRMLVYITLPEEGEETFAFLDTMHGVIAEYYPENAYIVGNSTSDYDLSKSFSRDNILISILSALFVIIVLFFTFKSAGLPILLIAVIQGSIWINFSFPVILQQKQHFLGYLIVSSIQMGANIDYAIVISSRFSELKQKMKLKDAIIETLNAAFPTIITSGVILAAAGTLIAYITTNGAIMAIGESLGRGTVLSIILVMGVLPQILVIGNNIIEKTAYEIKKPDIITASTGRMMVNGRVRGRISGFVDADIRGLVRGDINAVVRADNVTMLNDEETPPLDESDSIEEV